MLLIFLLPVSRKAFFMASPPAMFGCFDKSEQRAFSLSRSEGSLESLLFFH